MSHIPRKRFGQHFLRDKQVLKQLLDAIAPQSCDYLVEIGPGQGALTDLLYTTIKHLDVIEIDRDLCRQLATRYASSPRITIHCQDILDFALEKLVKEQKLRVVGNLPYNISTPILFHLLNYTDSISDMHFMLQLEVVKRICAQPNESHYGRLSVMLQYHCQCELLFTVNAQSFYPPPAVTSAMLRLTPYEVLPNKAINYQTFALVVKQAFAKRRKIIRNSLREIICAEKLKAMGFEPTLRAQQLKIADFVKISNAVCYSQSV